MTGIEHNLSCECLLGCCALVHMQAQWCVVMLLQHQCHVLVVEQQSPVLLWNSVSIHSLRMDAISELESVQQRLSSVSSLSCDSNKRHKQFLAGKRKVNSRQTHHTNTLKHTNTPNTSNMAENKALVNKRMFGAYIGRPVTLFCEHIAVLC